MSTPWKRTRTGDAGTPEGPKVTPLPPREKSAPLDAMDVITGSDVSTGPPPSGAASMRVSTADSTTSTPPGLGAGSESGRPRAGLVPPGGTRCDRTRPRRRRGVTRRGRSDGDPDRGRDARRAVGGGGCGAGGSTPTGPARPDRARRSDRRRGDLSGRGPRGERSGGRVHRRSRLDRSPTRPRGAPGLCLAPVRGTARRAPHQPGASTKRRGRIRRGTRRRWSAVRGPRRHRDPADRRAWDRGADGRHLRRLAAVPRRRCGRTPPHAVDRVGDHRGGRGCARHDRPATADGLAARPRHGRTRDDEPGPDRHHRRHATRRWSPESTASSPTPWPSPD